MLYRQITACKCAIIKPMPNKNQLTNSKAIFTVFAFIFVSGLLIYTLFFMFRAKNTYISELNRALTVQSSSADTIAKLYKYVKLPNNTKSLAILPYQYKQEFGLLALASKTNPESSSYTPKQLENVAIPAYASIEPAQVRKEVNPALVKLNEAAQKAGLFIMVRSGYRSYALQQQLKLANSSNDLVAEAGESEHQTGLAVDINSTSVYCGDACGLDVVTAAWLAANAPNYGFILRYPPAKQASTGYPYESWHFRYVGEQVAKAVAASGLTYDEAYALFLR